jgi:Tol biopolymer transport system component
MIFVAMLSVQAFAEPFAKGPYLGQTPPGSTPQAFAPGLICRPGNLWESDGTFSTDGKVFSYRQGLEVYVTQNTPQGWTTPARVTGLDNKVLWAPTISPDGKSLYYTGGANFFRTDRTVQGWTTPQQLGPPLSSSANEWGGSLAAGNSFYFCSHRPGGRGGCDIWHARFADGTWSQACNITDLNTTDGECNPGIAPDESFMVFQSNRAEGLGQTDLYLSLRQSDGSWSSPRNLGPRINSTDKEIDAHISPDKLYLFFTRCNGWNTQGDAADIYWVALKEYLPDPNSP